MNVLRSGSRWESVLERSWKVVKQSQVRRQKTVKPWSLKQQMQFLKPFIQEKTLQFSNFDRSDEMYANISDTALIPDDTKNPTERPNKNKNDRPAQGNEEEQLLETGTEVSGAMETTDSLSNASGQTSSFKPKVNQVTKK